jgi:hypothetical protein
VSSGGKMLEELSRDEQWWAGRKGGHGWAEWAEVCRDVQMLYDVGRSVRGVLWAEVSRGVQRRAKVGRNV